MYIEPQSQQKLFGHQEIFQILKKLQLKKKLPNKIILLGNFLFK